MVQFRNTLKSWFETGDFPNQNQFWDLIDSFFHKSEDKIAFTDLSSQLQSAINNISGFPVTLPAGTTSWTADVDMVIELIRVYDPASIAFGMGTTPGGNELWNDQDVNATSRLLRQDIDAPAGTTYYFSGVTENTMIKIYKR